MTEISPTAFSPEQRVNDIVLAELGARVVEASQRPYLEAAVGTYATELATQNPNSIGSEGLFIAGTVPMDDKNVYRQVGVEAIDDLGTSGVVRNGATAQGASHPRWGNRVFWNPGDNRNLMSTGGRTIIEADKAAAQTGWVTAADVKGVYAKDSDGIVKNILPS